MRKDFERICKMSQKNLKKFVRKELQKIYDTVISDDGFVYAEGEVPVLLVAHLDTVHAHLPHIIFYNKDILSSPNGIGGDDRCGVYMIFEMIKKHKCSVLFCEDEEVGCVGAEKFIHTNLASDLIGKFNYIMEFDRRGKNDAVFYDCDNKDFEAFITKEYYKTDMGSFSDISTIAPYLECAAVNLSCGYYNAHTTKEYVVWAEMEKSIEEASKIIARTKPEDKFEYVEALYGKDTWGLGWETGYGPAFGDAYYVITYYEDMTGDYACYETYATSEEEAVGMFMIDHRNLTFNHIVDIMIE